MSGLDRSAVQRGRAKAALEDAFGLGKALMDEGQFAEAARYLEQCVKVKPSYSAAYLALVESLLKIDQKDKAKQFAQEGHAVSVKNGDMQVTKKIEAIQATLV